MAKDTGITLIEYITPRIERRLQALYLKVDQYEQRAEAAGEDPDIYATGLVNFLQLSVHAAGSTGFDFALVEPSDDADTIYSKFEQYSDTQQYPLVKRLLAQIDKVVIGDEAALPVAGDADPN